MCCELFRTFVPFLMKQSWFNPSPLRDFSGEVVFTASITGLYAMKNKYLSHIGLWFSLLLLTACGAPNTPQAVTDAFWNAVIDNDAAAVVKLSTLTSEEGYDSFGREWNGFDLKLGRVVIDREKATVEAVLTKVTAEREDQRELTTYLFQRDGQWVVDYTRTGREASGGELGAFFGRISDAISEKFDDTRKATEPEIEDMNQQLQAMSDDIARQAEAQIQDYSEELSDYLDEFADSIEDLLEEKQDELSPQDTQKLSQMISRLRASEQSLAEPSFSAISEATLSAGIVQSQLALMDEGVVGESLEEWRKEYHEVMEEMKVFIRELMNDQQQ